MGAHRDNEPDLDPEAPIASLTVGHARDFILRYSKKRDTNDDQVLKLTLENGSLLIMKPPTNNFWYHSIPKRKKITSTTGPRINFTFRKILIKTQNPIIL
uniref:Fe2OG dioxygenase domain-containing protein n=1 Tax=Romanomermis culicivorax TaxID=13658 RepID=A0A915HLM9_ROMCU